MQSIDLELTQVRETLVLKNDAGVVSTCSKDLNNIKRLCQQLVDILQLNNSSKLLSISLCSLGDSYICEVKYKYEAKTTEQIHTSHIIKTLDKLLCKEFLTNLSKINTVTI